MGASHRVLAAALATGSVLSGQALAQDTTSEEETIVVTGSRIHTDPLTNRQPVAQIGQEDIARTGLSPPATCCSGCRSRAAG
jgi:outer membrane cobalamin receptor